MALAMFVCKEHGRGRKRVRNFCTMKDIYLWCQRIRKLKKKKKDGMAANVGQGGDDISNFKASSVKYGLRRQGTRQLYSLTAMILCLHSSLT